MAVAAGSFVVLLTGILATYWLFVVRPEKQTQQAFWRRLRARPGTAKPASKLLKQAQQLSAVPTLDAALRRGQDVLRPIELLIEQSGNSMTVGAFLLASGTSAVIVAYIAM